MENISIIIKLTLFYVLRLSTYNPFQMNLHNMKQAC